MQWYYELLVCTETIVLSKRYSSGS